MATVAPQTAQFKTLAADLYGDRAPSLLAHPAFAARLAHAAAQAHTTMPRAGDRIDRAVRIVLAGGVRVQANGTALVQSQSHSDVWHGAGGSCECEDAIYNAIGGWCSHRIAATLYRQVQAAMQDEASPPAYDRPTVPPCETATDTDGVPCYAVHAACPGHSAPPQAALPEARASINAHLVIGGVKAQITLRDDDETRLLARFAALVALYPSADVAQTHGAPGGAEITTPSCPDHGPMKASTVAPGTWFCPKRLADGESYCNIRYPAKAGRTARR